MHKAVSIKYLGDSVHESGKTRFNVLERRTKANAAFAEIRAILEDVPLGKYRIEVGLHLRQALFINGVMFNSEVWHGINKSDIDVVSVVDHKILRYICEAHAKTPTEFLFLETGSLPLSYIIRSRRMIYLQNILKRDEGELVRRVYNAQKKKPTVGDYSTLVQEDFNHINVSMDENGIIAMTDIQYKKYIKKHIHKAALIYLKQIQAPHPKVNNIEYKSLLIQPYMISHEFNNPEVTMLTALRSHTIRNIKMNFSSWYKNDLSCSLKCQEIQQNQDEDSQQHLLVCNTLLSQLSQEQYKLIEGISYNDLYSNTVRQKLAVTGFTWLLNIRERLLEATTPAIGVTLVAASTPGGNSGLP